MNRVCDPEPAALPFDFLKPVIIGEFHGTEQSRPFVISTVCMALRQGKLVTLAVEMPPEAVEDALVRPTINTFWRTQFPDGRASIAARAMLADLRELHDLGVVNVIGFLAAEETPSDTSSARRIRQGARAGDAVIVIVGSYHARRPALESDASTLTTALGDAVNVRIANSKPGSAWACVPECGVQSLGGSTGSLPLAFNPVSAANGFDYYYVVETFTPSVPF